ncbi:hypothetical protein E0H75_06790 [Kribbella capetownensis]|uniref:Lipoprotein LpqN n=1 Tax=Kribbella capetownensis TaxID=1572659 RepID=A0A4R0KDB6_9ACTN|nr:hypothetical protein [Kribbella capetownensis]TCC53405.1 hypothetical protein E0H75_06790 [Kribbella capetownensis]
MKRPILVIVLLLITVLGAAGGYFAGDRWDIPAATASGEAAPLGQVTPAGPTPSQTPSDPPLPVKTPVPNTIPPLETDLSFRRRTFTVSPKDYQSVQMAIEVPDGWHFKTDPKRPAEVKYLDSRNERGVRVEANRPPIPTKDALAGLVIDLKKSLPPQDDLRIQSQTTEQIVGDDDQMRTVSTLVYTYIPTDTLRYVIVRWVSTNGDDLANVEMSITGLPDDSPALDEVLLRATQSVRETG